MAPPFADVLTGLPKKAYVFDKDGTLVDTESVWFAAYERLLAPYGAVHALAVHRRMMGLSGEDCVRVLQEAYPALPQGVGGLDELLPKRAQAFQVVREERGVHPLPGIPAFLEVCQQVGICLAVATSAARKDAVAEFAALGWTNVFETIVTADDIVHHKPAPDAYLEAARRLDLAPADCLAFEDGLNGLASARAAGMPVVFVRDARFGIEVPFVVPTVASFEELLVRA